MIKTIFITAFMLSSCMPSEKAQDSVQDTTAETGDSQTGATGIVSEDPPGADDWNNDSDADSEDSGEEDTSDSGEAPVESYSGCSNIIDWRQEPDPLNHPCNFRLVDQNGNNVELYDYQGDVIMLDFSTVWCSVCKTVAAHVQEMNDSMDPFTVITILSEDSSGDRPDVDDLKEWAGKYGITTSPVLAGTDELLGQNHDQWNMNGIPFFFVIDKDFYLRKMQPGWNETTMTEYIESLILE